MSINGISFFKYTDSVWLFIHNRSMSVAALQRDCHECLHSGLQFQFLWLETLLSWVLNAASFIAVFNHWNQTVTQMWNCYKWEENPMSWKILSSFCLVWLVGLFTVCLLLFYLSRNRLIFNNNLKNPTNLEQACKYINWPPNWVSLCKKINKTKHKIDIFVADKWFGDNIWVRNYMDISLVWTVSLLFYQMRSSKRQRKQHTSGLTHL